MVSAARIRGRRNLDELERLVQESWTRDTSSDPDRWSAENPAWGQCAVTALVVQDEGGGDLLRTIVCGISHYWNRLPDGREVDLTRQQFGPHAEVGEGEIRDRTYVLSFPETQERYRRLTRRLGIPGRQPN